MANRRRIELALLAALAAATGTWFGLNPSQSPSGERGVCPPCACMCPPFALPGRTAAASSTPAGDTP